MVKGLFERFRGNPLESLSIRELQEEELRLTNKLNKERAEIEKLEEAKKKKFQEGIGASALKKRVLAQEIQALDLEAKLRLQSFTKTQNMLKITRNLLVVKKLEKDLREQGIWKKLASMPREKLEEWLLKVRLDGRESNEILEELNRPFEMEIMEAEEGIGTEEKRLLELWEKVEQGALEPEKVEEELSVEREPEKGA
mgnify:CR=1 FL=1